VSRREGAGAAAEQPPFQPGCRVVSYVQFPCLLACDLRCHASKETRAVAQWLEEREPQRPHVLRFALQLATMIAGSEDAEIARAWFHGSNPHLADEVPTLLLRRAPLSEVQGPLLGAARAFAKRS